MRDLHDEGKKGDDNIWGTKCSFNCFLSMPATIKNLKIIVLARKTNLQRQNFFKYFGK